MTDWEDITDNVPKKALDEFNSWWKQWQKACMDVDVAERRELFDEEGKRWKVLCEVVECDTKKYEYQIRFDRLFRRKI